MGAQELIKFFAWENSESGISNIWNNTLCCPAAKQMLKYHADNQAQYLFDTYYYSIHNLNLATNGYPSNLRKISVIDGSVNNIMNGQANQIAFQGTVFLPTNLIVGPFSGLHLPAAIVNLQIRNVADNGNEEVLRLDCFLDTFLGPIYFPITRKFNNNSGNTSPDVAPGGTYNTYDQVHQALKNISVIGDLTAVSINQNIHCFMPITSTLDIIGNMNYCTDISSRDLVAEGLTPFDSYTGVTDSNMYHVTFNQQLVDYMLNEIETYIQGPREVQECSHTTYTLHLPQDSIATVTWQSSSNFHLVTGSNPYSVTIIPLGEGDGWISAEVSTLKHRKSLAHYPVHILPYENNTIPAVSSTTIQGQSMTISTNSLLIDTFCIENGKTLTVTGTLYCAPGTRIIVRPGGKLIVDGGTLTSACDDVMWQGIEVVGDRNKRQYAMYQGAVNLMNGATIENALCGIRTGLREDTVNFATTGGIIFASNSYFLNNRQAVEINSYTLPDLNGGLPIYNASFTNCTFSVDGNNLFSDNNTSFSEHVRLWEVNGVHFNGCTFTNTSGGLFGHGRGIYAHDAGVILSEQCSPNYVYNPGDCGCPPIYADTCVFSGFTTAVEVSTSGNPYLVDVNRVRFENNVTGLRINANNYATVTRCDFNLDNAPGFFTGNVGLSLNTCTGYKVEGNISGRTAYPSGPLTIDNSYGIAVANSGYSSNSLYRNFFVHLTRGFSVSGTNSGLQIGCGSFTDNKYDIYIPGKASISSSQGSLSQGADITFMSTRVSSIYNSFLQNITYHYSNGNNHAPISPHNVTLDSQAGSNSCQSTLCGGIVPHPFTLTDFQSGINAYTAALGNNTDGGGQALSETARELSETYYEAVRALMADTVLDLSTLEQWHAAAQPIADPYSLTETRFAEGYSEMFTADADDAELANYADFHAMKVALRNAGVCDTPQQDGHINWYAMTPAQITQLQAIAERNAGRASVMAKGVLCFFHGICYDDDLFVDDNADNNDNNMETRSAKAAQQDAETLLNVYPNPADDLLYLELSGAGIANAVLYDLQGRIVADAANAGGRPATTMNVHGVPAGVYLLRVTDTDGREYHRKIVVK